MKTIPLFVLAAFLPAFGQTPVVNPTAFTFAYQVGGSQPASQFLNVTSTGTNFTYSVFTSGATWLSVFPTSGFTPSAVTVSVSTAGLGPGTYSGSLTVVGGFSSVTALVTLTITGGSAATATPSTLGFTYSLGGTLPFNQTVAISSFPSGLNFSTTALTQSGGSWLAVVPLAAQTPANLTVSVNPAGLQTGTYAGQVNVFISTVDNPLVIPVTFTVTPTGTTALTLNPASLGFAYQIGGQLPGQQSVAVTTPSAATFTVSAPTVTWLQVSSLTGTAPGTILITPNPVGLAAGAYATNLTINASNGGAAILPISLTVSNQGTITAAGFVPVTPCRVADTRASSGFGGSFGPPILTAQSTRDFVIPSSVCGIPFNAQAYSLNITVVPTGGLSFLTAWPSGQGRPNASTLNAFDGAITSNAAIVPAGGSGAISIFVTDTTDVIIDINGYFTNAPGALALYPVSPCRVADTRLAAGTFGGPQMTAGSTRDFPIPLSACGISPAAQAFSLNATVVPPAPLSFLTLFPSGQARPNVSTLNSFDGAVKANAAIVPGAANGSVSAFVTDRADLILDINAYFAPPGFLGGLSFYPVTPCRVADTRVLFGGPIASGTSRDFQVVSTCGIPANASAFSFNVTVVPSGGLSFLTMWPTGNARPLVSTLNSFAGKILANAAIVPTGVNGAVSVFATDTTHVILDINGYFAP